MRRPLHLPLVLVQQGDGLYKRQVLHMVAPGAGFVRQERQLMRERVHHLQRSQQPLRILVQPGQITLFARGQQPLQRLRLPLHGVDGMCLLPRQEDPGAKAGIFF